MKRKTARKPKPARARRSVKRGATSRRAGHAPVTAKASDALDDLAVAGAQALGLAIEPAWRDSIKFNLQLIFEHAARVDEFALPDEAEPAPVFHA